ncbi:MAG: glycosyltransferase family 4 protein [Rhodovibrionaceae bacterium]
MPSSTLFISQSYRPEPIGSGPYVTDMAEYLAAHGAEVEVLTTRPSYPEGVVSDGYRRGERDREMLNGVAVRRLRPWFTRKRGALGRLLREAAFLASGLLRLASGAVRRRSRVVSLCPSIFAVLLGCAATRRGGRHIALVHDVQSGLAAGLSMLGNGRAVRALQWLERQALNRCDGVLVLSEPMREHLHSLGVTAPIDVLPIWIDTAAVQPRPARSNKFRTAMYSGNFGRKQALDQVLDMAAVLRGRGAPLRVLLRGQGSETESLKARAAARQLDNVRFEPLVPVERLAESLAEGDIHLVTQHPLIADFAVPSKVFAIMAAGRPIVAAAPPGSMLWSLQERCGGFLCVPSGDTEALAAAVERLAGDSERCSELGRRARDYVVQAHDKQRVLGDFLLHLDGARA